jgi:protein-S-isoprenylcysteine O-methyltransferase Ste14
LTLAYGSAALWVYTVAVAIAFHLRIVFREELALAKTFGEAWRGYSGSVPRWLWSPHFGGHRQQNGV